MRISEQDFVRELVKEFQVLWMEHRVFSLSLTHFNQWHGGRLRRSGISRHSTEWVRSRPEFLMLVQPNLGRRSVALKSVWDQLPEETQLNFLYKEKEKKEPKKRGALSY